MSLIDKAFDLMEILIRNCNIDKVQLFLAYLHVFLNYFKICLMFEENAILFKLVKKVLFVNIKSGESTHKV